eukprot:scaffold241822_cov21-Tisochrysis_lutea.AAC.1
MLATSVPGGVPAGGGAAGLGNMLGLGAGGPATGAAGGLQSFGLTAGGFGAPGGQVGGDGADLFVKRMCASVWVCARVEIPAAAGGGLTGIKKHKCKHAMRRAWVYHGYNGDEPAAADSGLIGINVCYRHCWFTKNKEVGQNKEDGLLTSEQAWDAHAAPGSDDFIVEAVCYCHYTTSACRK